MVAGYEQARCRCGAFAAWLSGLDRSRADARRRGASHFPFDGMGSAGQRRTLPRSCECLSWMRSTRAGAPHGPFSAQVALLDALNPPRRPECSRRPGQTLWIHPSFAPHSITSSATASRFGGIVRSSIRAVSAFMTSSNFEDCTTGRSADGAPVQRRAPAADRTVPRPSGIRSPDSRPRHNRPLSGLGERPAGAPSARQAIGRWPITGIAGCCARAANGHAAAAPPSAASNSRRPMVTVIRPSREGCVKATIPRHQRAVLRARTNKRGPWPNVRS